MRVTGGPWLHTSHGRLLGEGLQPRPSLIRVQDLSAEYNRAKTRCRAAQDFSPPTDSPPSRCSRKPKATESVIDSPHQSRNGKGGLGSWGLPHIFAPPAMIRAVTVVRVYLSVSESFGSLLGDLRCAISESCAAISESPGLSPCGAADTPALQRLWADLRGRFANVRGTL